MSLFLVVALVVIFPIYVSVWWQSPHTFDGDVTLKVESGETFSSLTNRLKQANLISSSNLFSSVARLLRATRDVRAGEYEFSDKASPSEILQKLRGGISVQYLVRLPEGGTFEDYRQILIAEEALENDIAELSVADTLAAFGIEDDATRSVEGWFLPETYAYLSGDLASSVFIRAYEYMKSTLISSWTERKRSDALKSPYELLILASIIEKESGRSDDRMRISGVFHERLRIGMRLQSDPTVIYALGNEFDGNLSRSNLRIVHTHNTYRIDGLPPTPIACPSKSSLRAAAQPTKSNYLYFVARGDGSSEFSETLAEHNAAVAKYISAKKDNAR